MSHHILNTSDQAFDKDVLQASKPILVDFWAEWCSPCKALLPILEEVATHYGDKLTVAKVNIDENTTTPQKYGIRGIPTLILFKNGNQVATKVGVLSKSQLIEFIDSHL